MEIVIAGGVAGGMFAATRLRRLMEDAEIVVFEKELYVSFASCGLPYYLPGGISEQENLLVQTPESLFARFCLDVRPSHEVTAIFPENKTVEVVHEGQEHIEQYDMLVLSPGAKPVVPSTPGITEADNVFSTRNVLDINKVMHALEKQPERAVIVGAGFIGLEMAETLKRRGLEVMVIEQTPHILPTLDEEMAAFIEKELSHQEVEVITSHIVAGFEDHGKRLRLNDGHIIPAGLVILSIGVRPDSQLAVTAGIELGIRGGTPVDKRYQTNIPNIYAVGDVIVVKQQITGKDILISLASPASRQGGQVADMISGIFRRNQGGIGTAIIWTFGMTAASTGLSERTAKKNELSFEVIHVSGKGHASYHPEATDTLLKLIFHPKAGEIYGAQGVGAKGMDKRIDILATAIKGYLTIFDLPELELTYAPPLGSAKDPVNMLGYTATSIAEGLSETIQWHELPIELTKGKILLDVWTAGELEKGKFKEAKHIPLNELRDRLNELDSQQEYIVSCRSELHSYLAEKTLKRSGYHVKNLDGAFFLYQTARPEELIHPNKWYPLRSSHSTLRRGRLIGSTTLKKEECAWSTHKNS